jgi:ribonuclease J
MSKSIEFLPLGGLKQVGKNCMLLKYGRSVLMIDCGMGFAGNDDFMEDDFFIPDFEIINELDIELAGCVITHGHEDHIGGVPYLLKQFDVPVYMTEFPSKILEERISRYSKYKKNINVLKSKGNCSFKLGPFDVTMIDVPHSIPEAKSLIIKVGEYNIVHSGDFKGDSTKNSPFKNKIPSKVDVFLVDSTNIESEGNAADEKSIIKNLENLIENAAGRVVVTGFSSNVSRIRNIIDISIKKGRTVGLMGRSVLSYTGYAKELGYIKLPPSIVTDLSKINKVPENKLTLVVTGSQAETRSIMKRMSLDMMKSVSIKYGDTIIFSSKMIPGNEISIGRMIDDLMEKGANVFYEKTDHIHVSGHAKKNDIINAIRDVNPDLVIPVHGHRRFLELLAKTSEKEGCRSRVITDGDILTYNNKKGEHISHRYELDTVIVSNNDPDLVDLENIRERKRIAKAGFMNVMMTVDFLSNGLLSQPRIVSAGIATPHRMKKIEREIKDLINEYFTEELSEEPYWKDVEEEIRIKTRRYLFSILKKKPIVNAIIVNLD